ncbi:hypothetical protein Sjap_007529 [Stephania japonica]|uniref:Uncharacterized protein n=1 Tax=Stephania japonica TaxID=461633 RepID=A0AAP0JQ07_9MAGN
MLEPGLVSVASVGHHVKESVAQDDLVSSMKEAAAKELLPVSHDHHSYKRLLKDLMVQVSLEISLDEFLSFVI